MLYLLLVNFKSSRSFGKIFFFWENKIFVPFSMSGITNQVYSTRNAVKLNKESQRRKWKVVLVWFFVCRRQVCKELHQKVKCFSWTPLYRFVLGAFLTACRALHKNKICNLKIMVQWKDTIKHSRHIEMNTFIWHDIFYLMTFLWWWMVSNVHILQS